MKSPGDRVRNLLERFRARRTERTSTQAQRAQRRAQADALRLENKRNTPFGGSGGG